MTSRGYDPRQSPGLGYKRVVSCKDSSHDDGLKLIGPEDDLRVGDRMRSYRSVAEPAKLDLELLADDVTQPLGGRTRPGRIIVDMRVIAPIRDGVGGVG